MEQATQLIDKLSQQVAQLMTRATSADEENKQMHMELVKTEGQLAQANAGGKSEFRLIDPKTMIPEKLGSNKSPWRQWAGDTRAYVAMLSPDLSKKLKSVEGLET